MVFNYCAHNFLLLESQRVFTPSLVMNPFMSQNTVSITFFINNCAQNFFFTGESECFHSIISDDSFYVPEHCQHHLLY